MRCLPINTQSRTKTEGGTMAMGNARIRTSICYGIALAAALCAALWLCAFAGAGDAEARTYPAAEKKIEAAVSKGRTWVDFGSTQIPWQDACKAFQKVKRKKAGYIVKAKDCQTWRHSGSPYAFKMKVSYRNAAQRKALNARAKAMMKKVSNWDSQLEKVEKIHDAIIKRSNYDYTSYYSGKLREDSGSVYGNLVRGRSVCAGYAEAFQLVALKAGLQSRYVCNGSHAWNLVRVGGKWYHIDVCWDDTSGSKRKYFLKGSKTMAKVKSHGIKDCYPSKVSVSKGDYVVKAPPVEVVDDEAGKADSSKGDLTAGTPAGGTAIGRPSEGSTGKTDGAPASAVKDPSKGVNAGKNDASGPGEYTGGGTGGLSTKDPSAGPATTGNAPIGAGSIWAGPSN